MTEKYFYVDDITSEPGYYTIRLNHDKFPFKTPINGSFNIFIARITGLDFPDYLRFCRDILGATLVGKTGYSYPIFKRTKELDAYVKFLNKQAEYALYCRAHPYDIKQRSNGDYIKEFYNDTIRKQYFR